MVETIYLIAYISGVSGGAFIAITYTEERNFTPQQVSDLFLSVRWVVGKNPDRLQKALMNSSRVISAWDGDRLVGLIRVMDDSKNAPFYEKQGFKVKERIN